MQEHDDNSEALTPVGDTTNGSELKVWERLMAIAFIAVASTGLLVCAGLLIQVYITQKPEFELLGYIAEVFYLAGYLALIIALNISAIVNAQRKQFGYISASIGAVLMFLSFGLLFASHKPDLEWWGYFYTVASGTGLGTITFFILISTEQKRLRRTLGLITFLLIIVASVLLVLEFSNAGAIAAGSFLPE